MKINIKPQDCKFYVNKEKRKIVCVLEGTRDLLTTFIECNDNADYFWLDKCLILPNRFVGIATCSTDDEWDEAFGRTLAFKRLKDSFYTAFFKHADKYADILNNKLNAIIEDFNNLGIKVEASISKREKEIENYFKARENKELKQV